jgi:hypothetical protein
LTLTPATSRRNKMELDKLVIGLSVAAAFFAYCLSKAVYNLFFHPLAKFPGPWWAGISYLAEFYYDVIEGGRYFMVVTQLHEKYGERELLLCETELDG